MSIYRNTQFLGATSSHILSQYLHTGDSIECMEPLLAWETYEYEPRSHSQDWYWIVGIITVAIVVISIILGNPLLGIILALGALILGFFTTRHPELHTVALYEKGIQVDKVLYPYENLHSFAVVEKDVLPKLIIQPKRWFLPYIILKINGHAPESVEEILRPYLPEDEHVEPIIYKILDYLGF